MSLSNFELQDIAKLNHIPLDMVVSKDELLLSENVYKFKSLPNWNIIINLQNLYDDNGNIQPGSHWVSLSKVKTKKIEPQLVYWDSYGFEPPLEVIKLAEMIRIKNIAYNNKQIQRVNTTICGYYSLFFIYYLRHYLKSKLNPLQIIERLNQEFKQPIDNIGIFKKLLKRYF